MNKIYREITQCRVCRNKQLLPILHLGDQALTGVFPRSKDQVVPQGPLELVRCDDSGGDQYCGLVQLRHSYPPSLLYADGYGYRSSLNQSMVKHLAAKAERILQRGILSVGDIVVDIGSNDGTLLKSFGLEGLTLVGIDPIGKKFQSYYPPHIQLIPHFFSSGIYRSFLGSRQAKVVTSVAMFYDLDDPLDFFKQVDDILDEQGILVLEQAYMPMMIEHLLYDAVCHEHMAYYSLRQIQWIAQRCGFKIIELEFNEINGGSFSVVLSKGLSAGQREQSFIDRVLDQEQKQRKVSQQWYQGFHDRVLAHRDRLRLIVAQMRSKGQKLTGYGASTKGNVILQYSGFTDKDISFIAEVNADKFGAFTPGSLIPIISEAQASSVRSDCKIVFPWHFKTNIIQREQTYLNEGGRLLFPLPEVEIIGR